MDVNKTYMKILINTLEKKLFFLDGIMHETLIQEEILNEAQFDIEKYQASFDVKEDIIKNIFELDQGFDSIYDRIKEEITNNKSAYKEDIIKLQELINELTVISIKLQTLERKNKTKMELYFSRQKSEIKRMKISNKTALGYYKNMTDQHQEGQSYFIDKKK